MKALGRWLAGRPPPQEPAGFAVAFDAVISVGPNTRPPGIAPGFAVAAIRQAVQAMPGACWISVEHASVGSGDGAVEVFPTGTSRPSDDALRQSVEATVLEAVGSLASQPAVPLPRHQPVPRAEAIPETAGFSFPIPASSAQAGLPPGVAEAPLPQFDPPPPEFLGSVPDRPSHDVELRAAGLRALSDSELLTYLLGLVLPAGAPEAAQEAIGQFGSFAATLAAPEHRLRKLRGFGTHSVAAIKLLHAMALRLSRAAVMDQPVLDGSEALLGYLTAVLAREGVEQFRILFLDARDRLCADEAQARGTVDHAPVYPREVARRAMELQAASIILVHNHPSGDPQPSAADFTMTAQVAQATEAVGVAVRDHIIVGAGRWYSFRDQGMLDD